MICVTWGCLSLAAIGMAAVATAAQPAAMRTAFIVAETIYSKYVAINIRQLVLLCLSYYLF
jgi:hypothetical protein